MQSLEAKIEVGGGGECKRSQNYFIVFCFRFAFHFLFCFSRINTLKSNLQ